MTHFHVEDRGFMSIHLYNDFGWQVLFPKREIKRESERNCRKKAIYDNATDFSHNNYFSISEKINLYKVN